MLPGTTPTQPGGPEYPSPSRRPLLLLSRWLLLLALALAAGCIYFASILLPSSPQTTATALLQSGLHFVINAHLSFFFSFSLAQSIFIHISFYFVLARRRAGRHDFTFLAGAFVCLLIEETLKVKFCLPHCYNPEKHECTAVFFLLLTPDSPAGLPFVCPFRAVPGPWSFFNEVSAAICWLWLFDMQLGSWVFVF